MRQNYRLNVDLLFPGCVCVLFLIFLVGWELMASGGDAIGSTEEM